MLADFKRMQAVKPELTEKGQVAIFKLAANKEQPARTIKLQKAGSDWRLFDDAAARHRRIRAPGQTQTAEQRDERADGADRRQLAVRRIADAAGGPKLR